MTITDDQIRKHTVARLRREIRSIEEKAESPHANDGISKTLLTEERVPLPRLAAALSVDRSTIARWADVGYDGVQLESFRIGKKRFSSLPAVRRFLAATNRGQQAEVTAAANNN